MRPLLQLLPATFQLMLAFIRASWYVERHILRDLALPPAATLSKREMRRLRHYFYGTTYLAVIFCSLRGRRRSREERQLFTHLSALAYFFDDLVDAFRGQDKSGILWQDNPEQYGHLADERGLALHFLQYIYRKMPPGDLAQFKQFMHRVFNLETAGRQALGSNGMESKRLQRSTLVKITAEKGGYSVLLFRRVLQHPLLAEEQEALLQLGYLVQLCDDIFDLWPDRQAGIVTLATFFADQNKIEALSAFFERQVLVVRRAMSGDRGKCTWPLVHFLVSITRVCLHHYAFLLKKHGNLPLDDRSAMVVDMERWGNRARVLRELLRY